MAEDLDLTGLFVKVEILEGTPNAMGKAAVSMTAGLGDKAAAFILRRAAESLDPAGK